jgi:Flp pilus assembly pilin Flp
VQLVNYAILSFVGRLRTERGQDLLEYAMLGGLIAAAIVTVFAIIVGTGGSGIIDDMANRISNCIDFDSQTACTGGL